MQLRCINTAPSAPPEGTTDRVVRPEVAGSSRPRSLQRGLQRPAVFKRGYKGCWVFAHRKCQDTRELAGDISAGESPLLGLPPKVTRDVRPVALCESFSDDTAPDTILTEKKSPKPKPIPQPKNESIVNIPVHAKPIDERELETLTCKATAMRLPLERRYRTCYIRCFNRAR